MTVFSIIYTIIFKPLQVFLEFIFVLADEFIGSPVLAIVALSLVMNLLVLPLYRRADAMQEAQRQLEKKMAPDLAFLKKTFKGDEKVMMMQTYYRQHNYKPIYALKGSLSLALEIPFFVAAYQFLSHLTLLEGVSCGPIADLGAPDAMLTLFGISINLLPVLMTAINFVSGYLYAKGYPVKTKIQLYGIALIFLVLLYNSPAGLVFYWTLNNLFSLAKNIFYRLIKNPKKVLKWLVAVCGTAICGACFFADLVSGMLETAFFALLFVLFWIPVFRDPFRNLFKKMDRLIPHRTLRRPDDILTRALFLSGCALLVLFLGAYIPSTVVSASPLEFLSKSYGPLLLIFHTFFLYAGLFLWIFIFYSLSGQRGKKLYAYALWLIAGVSLADFFTGADYGVMSSTLVFDMLVDTSRQEHLINLAIVCVVLLLFLLLIVKCPRVVKRFYPILIAAAFAVSVYNCIGIQQKVEEIRQSDEYLSVDEIKPILNLSTEGQNVVVLMLDRAIGGYAPYIFKEDPSLAESFDGFVWYPNTLSFGKCTNFAAPALFGGYEYTPEEMNKRSTESLEEKTNESLSVMPVLFADEGYDVTVCDPPYAGYQWISDLSVYDGYEGIDAFLTIGHYASSYEQEFGPETEIVQKSNFFFYSIFKTVPVLLQRVFYREGQYGMAGWQSGVSGDFLNSYGVLENLSALTEISDEDPCFLMMQNDTTHRPGALTVPDYTISPNADYEAAALYYAENSVGEWNQNRMDLYSDSQVMHYQVNVITYKALAAWFEYLKDNNVYDNTRIILVSDHGRDLGQFDEMLLDNGIDVETYNALLLVKDFNSHGEPQQDDAFMMIADVPTLATQGVIDDPVNPFTGKAINSDGKANKAQYITTSYLYDIDTNNGNTFDTSDGAWYAVTAGSILDQSNWTLVDEP